jgi:Rnl2 family RNA ligase
MFKKYNSIENSYRKEFLERLERNGLAEENFVVQEKVHGANLSYFTADGINFQTAKRNGVIQAGEKFYNFEILLNELQVSFQNIWNTLKEKYPNLDQMSIFGEVMGGDFPTEKLPKSKDAVKVQKGIFYTPNNHFYAFDILINNAVYLDVNEVNELFEQENMFYAKTLFEGNLEACLNYPNAFNSTIPKQLGLPEIENNICEGVVIRPKQSAFLASGNRAILKNKNDKWSENKRFTKTFKEKEPLPEKIIKLQEAAATYITENRLNNVLSKMGEVTKKDFGKILSALNKDVLEDFKKDFSEILFTLEKTDFRLITKFISSKSAILVRNSFRK